MADGWKYTLTVADLDAKILSVSATRTEGEVVRGPYVLPEVAASPGAKYVDGVVVGKETLADVRNRTVEAMHAEYLKDLAKEAKIAQVLGTWEAELETAHNARPGGA